MAIVVFVKFTNVLTLTLSFSLSFILYIIEVTTDYWEKYEDRTYHYICGNLNVEIKICHWTTTKTPYKTFWEIKAHVKQVIVGVISGYEKKQK